MHTASGLVVNSPNSYEKRQGWRTAFTCVMTAVEKRTSKIELSPFHTKEKQDVDFREFTLLPYYKEYSQNRLHIYDSRTF